MKLYCPIFGQFISEFVGPFIGPFIGQPAPGGGGTLPRRGRGILENIGQFRGTFLY